MALRVVGHDLDGEHVVPVVTGVIGDLQYSADDTTCLKVAKIDSTYGAADDTGSKCWSMALLNVARDDGAQHLDLRLLFHASDLLVTRGHDPLSGVCIEPPGIQKTSDQREVFARQHLDVQGVGQRGCISHGQRGNGITVESCLARDHCGGSAAIVGYREGHGVYAVVWRDKERVLRVRNQGFHPQAFDGPIPGNDGSTIVFGLWIKRKVDKPDRAPLQRVIQRGLRYLCVEVGPGRI